MCRVVIIGLLLSACVVAGASAADPWADQVVSYDPDDAADFTDASVVLGSPSRTTWESVNWPSTEELVSVRMTESPWVDYQVCKIGTAGHLTVAFDEPVANEPANPFGLDLLVFANRAFFSADWPANTTIGAGYFGGVIGTLSVSQDDVTYYRVASTGTLLPTQAFHGGASDAHLTGATPQDYTLPMDPDGSLDGFYGLTVAQALALYGTSGGGMGIDLDNLLDAGGDPACLPWIRYVKVEGWTSAIDAFADVSAVPEPATLGLLVVGGAAVLLRRKRA